MHSILPISYEELEQQRQQKKKVLIVSKDTYCPVITLAFSENLRRFLVVHRIRNTFLDIDSLCQWLECAGIHCNDIAACFAAAGSCVGHGISIKALLRL